MRRIIPGPGFRTVGPLALAATLVLAACGSDTTTTAGGNPDDSRPPLESASQSTGDDGATPTSGPQPVPAGGEVPDGATRLWIKPELVDCVGVGPQQCMEVAEGADGPYELFYDGIDGFTHEAGTSYVIDVDITEIDDPPADASSRAYTLIEIVEATPGG